MSVRPIARCVFETTKRGLRPYLPLSGESTA
jgi:hypothetical protein